MGEYNFEKVNTEELRKLLIEYVLPSNSSILILGRTGIGKSQIVRECAEEYAKSKNKVFVNWREASKEVKDDVIKNPNKYYVLVTYPMSLVDIGEFKVPFVKDNDTFRFLVNYIIYLFSKVEGVLFLDEVNLVHAKSLLNMLYQLVNERAIDEYTLKCSVIGAGNVIEDRADTSRISLPLLRRFVFRVELIFDENQFLRYMIKNKFDERIILFLQYNKELMYSIDVNTASSIAIPATWENFNKFIKGKDNKEALDLAGKILGPSAGGEFKTFIKLISEIDIDKLIKNPSEISKLDRAKKMASVLVLSRNINESNVGKIAYGLMQVKEDELIIMLLYTLKIVNEKMANRLLEEFDKIDKKRLEKICESLLELASL